MKIIIRFCVFILLSECQLLAQISDFTPYKSYNYVYSNTYLLKTASGTDYRENFQYVDGLGRPSQTVDYKGSPLQKDMIQPIAYDAYGREAIKYLPYTAASASGVYRSAWKTEQSTFYTTTLGYTTDGGKAYSETVFDNSPLNRVMKQGAPGDAWKVVNTTTVRQSSEHILSYQYATNMANEVYYWTISGTYPSITFTRHSYSTNMLFKNIVNDENNNPVTEYKDKQGKVVLKTDALGGKTYYIYDDFELLRCVIPPLASPTLAAASTFTLSNTTCNELCYYYEYDYRHRMIKKRIPGNTGSPGDYTMTYDNLDRLIQTIDPKGTKSYITYDVFSRPIVTGIYISGTPTWQTKTVYDTYNPGTDYSSTYPYQNIYGITRETAVKGKVTITINKVIDAAGDMKAELATVAYYDKYGRVIQSVSDNHKSGRDRISHKYKYKDSDLIAETRYDHGISGTTVSRSVVEKFAYDLSGRLKSTKHWINGQTDTTSLATMTYNEEGQLITKNINTLQTAAYKYNIRGWLTCINTPNIYSSSNLFALQLYYTGNSYNGNITKMDWMNVTGGYLVKSYEFSYDKLNRLTAGAYSEYDNHAYLPNSAGKYNESFSYDANGNIKTALRNGIIDDGTGLIGSIDNLNYKYFNSDKSNRLYAVGDYITDVSGRGDFNESGSDGFATQEYMYDNNGNMYRDYNRKSILSYNYLNLPNWVEDLNGNRIFTFYYSASGVKLRQQIYVDKYNSTGKYDYIGPFVYKDGVLNHIITSEGRARFSNGSFACYEFYLKDHLGNVRTVFEKNGSVPQVLQKNDYYAFGGLMGESTDATAYSNKYLYNGKEQVSTTNSPLGIDVSWYAYGARFYDPQLGRWHSIDPLTENTPSINPYQYCYNDPIKFFDRFGLAGETDIYGRPKYDENGIYIAPMDRQGGMTAKGYGDANYGHWTTKTTSIDIDGQYMCNKSENKEGEEIWELTYLPPIIGEKTTHLFWEWYNYSLPVASGQGGEHEESHLPEIIGTVGWVSHGMIGSAAELTAQGSFKYGQRINGVVKSAAQLTKETKLIWSPIAKSFNTAGGVLGAGVNTYNAINDYSEGNYGMAAFNGSKALCYIGGTICLFVPGLQGVGGYILVSTLVVDVAGDVVKANIGN